MRFRGIPVWNTGLAWRGRVCAEHAWSVYENGRCRWTRGSCMEEEEEVEVEEEASGNTFGNWSRHRPGSWRAIGLVRES